ncbi:LamG-like jellyroll fold domain-containing protein [Anaerobaca lacustris]|uniref:Discoidin domain-containing protein n=1 Tax=Anaerobaca lacustris TaxID=3044600 RepID=A0AAW6TWS5_9BACT|nr:discoidin domain-containing protein [Sedimentisphaerales bacterium M17dextr]
MRRELMPVLTVAMVLGAFGLGAARAADPSLVGWWKLDDGAGTTALDSSGRSIDGTLFGEPEWLAKAVYGGGLLFDGADDYIFIDGHFQLAEYAMTVWFRVDAAGQRDILSAYAVGVLHGILLEVQAAGTLRYLHRYPLGTGGGVNVYTTASYADGAWYHAAIVKSADQITLYVNGEQVGSTADASVFDPTDSFGLAVGVLDNERALDRLFLGAMDDIRVYDRALPQAEIQKAMAGLGPDSEKASAPVPEDNATDVPRDVILSWTAGEFAATHDVYFAAVFDDVNAAGRANPMGVLASQGQSGLSYDLPDILDFETTYYWRVDEVNAPPSDAIFKGNVWSFTTEPFAYAVENVVATSNGTSEPDAGPENTVNSSGIDENDQHSTAATDMWLANPPDDEPLYIQYEFDRIYKLHEMHVWNYNVMFELILGFGLKDVTVEYSENGEDWITLGDVPFTKATARANYVANTVVDFGGVAARYVRLTVHSGHGMMGQYGLSEIRFLSIPAQARDPQPADGAADVAVGSALSWRAGRDAASHEVYLGADADALALVATVAGATVTPGNLEFGRTYYWTVDAINPDDANPVWGSPLWSFSTQQYAWIDGFEDYTDDIDAGEAIFDTWLDGWVNNTGSTVGYLQAPFAERTIVHGGQQSMPLLYDNAVSPFYSETERVFDSPQNWTGNGADTLVVHVRGNAPDFKETADGQIIISAIGSDIWGTADQFRFAYKNLSGNGSIVVRVDSLVRSDEWAKAGVMIRETLEAGSKHAFVAVTPEPSHGVSFQRRPVAGQDSANTDVADIEMPHWVKLTRTGNVFTAQQSADGVAWVDITVTPALEIVMASNVYVGLAVTSHSITATTAAEFSNLSTTGNVTGAWQTAEIGATQPTGNSAEPMYVRIEDSAGMAATVVSADEAITLRPSWQEWKIPYADLVGVNLSRVQKMAIGVGNKTSPAAGGTGTVYIDDIGFGRPAATGQ